MLLEEIQFLSYGFLFLAMSKFSPVRFRLFFTRNVHAVVFLPVFVFWLFFLLLLVLSVLSLVAIISLSPRFLCNL